MTKIHLEAEHLNAQLDSVILNMLSKQGKRIYFSRKGILKQSDEAKNVKLNATIGIALADDHMPLGLPSLVKWMPDETSLPYAPGMGLPKLREIWQRNMLKKNPSLLSDNISKPVITSGISHGIFITGTLFLDQSEEILLPDKYWGNYRMLLGLSVGAKLVSFNLFNGNSLDFESFKQELQLQKGKTVLILTYPNNPSGYSPTKKEAAEIIKILTQHAETNETVVVCDDAYWGLVYEDKIEKESLFAKLSNAHENLLAVKLDGATKEDFAWGLRIGFMTFGKKGMTRKLADALEKKVTGVIRSQVSSSCHPSQLAVLRALESPTYDTEKQQNFDILKSRYQAVRKVLNQNKDRYSKYFTPIPFNSGYFMCVELIPELDASELRQKLIKDYDTGVIATENMLRIAFSCVAKKDIKELFENIYAACEESLS